MKRFFSTTLLTLILFLFTTCAKNPVTGKKEFMILSKEQESAMGEQANPEILSFFGVYDDDALQKFIQEKGQKMAKISHRSELDYKFKIVDSPVVNAFAVPGGYVYFTRGIMAYFNNEAEFAGVLGHEIGHIAARHSASQYSKQMLAQLGLVAGMVIAPELAQFADLASSGVSLLFFKFGRDDERESDRLGVEYSTKIGYDAQEMAEFFLTLGRLAEQSGAAEIPTFLSTHPSPEDRLKRVTKLAQEWKDKLDIANLVVDRNNYLKMIDGMVYGEDPRQGYVENSIFYHPVLKFKFGIPNEWTFQNTPQQVQMASKNGDALMSFTIAPGNSLQEAAQTILQKYKLALIDSKNTSVNGLPAVALVTEQTQQGQQGQQGQTIRALIYLIQYGGSIYSMMGVTTANSFDNYASLFTSVINSFAELNDPSKLNRMPDRIKVKPVKQTGTLAQALLSYSIEEKKLEELAILNGMQLTDRVEQGLLIKLIENNFPY